MPRRYKMYNFQLTIYKACKYVNVSYHFVSNCTWLTFDTLAYTALFQSHRTLIRINKFWLYNVNY